MLRSVPVAAFTKAYFKRCGQQGGKIGGKRRAASLSPQRRSEIARMGALAREAKKKNGIQEG